MTVHTRIQASVGALPRGRSLPADQWRERHRVIVRATALTVLPLMTVMLLEGLTPAHAVLEAAVPATIAAAAWYAPCSQRLRASMVALALMSVAAISVHATGTVEAHFLFFIAIPVVALYEDWAPFATSVFMVLVHHLAVGSSRPGALYNHEAAVQQPIRWGMIHAGLLFAMCVVSVVHWRIHERARLALTQQALHDSLTGLANRTLLGDRLAGALQARAEGPVALLMLDLDEFKAVNDTFGHAVGDALLVEVAERLRAAVREGDTAARLGGDEFALLLPGAGPDDACALAERLVDALSAPVVAHGKQVCVGASVGIALAPTAGGGPEQLIGQADEALLKAKRSGRGTCVRYRDDLDRAGSPAMSVSVTDAREWARYMTSLRADIAARKDEGRTAVQGRAPQSLHRVLSVLLAGIRELPDGPARADLLLPETSSLQEFVFHQAMVQHWADAMVVQGILSVRRSAAADAFWSSLRQRVTTEPDSAAVIPASRGAAG